MNTEATIRSAVQLPGVLPRELAETLLTFTGRAAQEPLALLALCPLVEGHTLRVKILAGDGVDLWCQDGCGAAALRHSLLILWAEAGE